MKRSSTIGCGLLALLLTLIASVHGQELPPVPADPGQATAPADQPPAEHEQLRRLIETLEDPGRRDELLAHLRALLAAQEQADSTDEEAPEQVLDAAASAIGEGTAALRDVVVRIIAAAERLPLLFGWLGTEWRDPARRALWLEFGASGVVVLGLGLATYLLAVAVLGSVRRRLALGARHGALARAIRVPLRLMFDLLAVLAFALVAYVTLDLVQPRGIPRVALEPLIDAGVLGLAAMALIRRVFSPDTPELRALPMSDDGARYGTRWPSRVALTWIFGEAILTALGRLGLPAAIQDAWLNVLFFAVAGMVALVIVDVRRPVRGAIESLAGEQRSTLVRWLPWRAVGAIWHLLALAYVAFVCLVWALDIPSGFRALVTNTLWTIAIALVAALVLSAIGRRPHVRAPTLDVAPSDAPLIERRMQRYRAWLDIVGRVAVVLFAMVAVLEVWGAGVLRWLGSSDGQIVLGHVITVALVALFTLVVWEGISLAIERSVSERDAEGNLRLGGRTRTLLNITRHFMLVFLGLIALFLILAELGLNIAPLLAGAGVLGLAIGFGSQKLVQDIITGMFVLFSDTMRVGDVVELGGRSGVVEAVTIRTVVLRDYGGNVHTVPYSAIDTVTNLTKGFSFAVFDLKIAYRERVDDVMGVLRELGAEMQRDPYFRRLILEPLEVAGVDRFDDSAVVIKARFKTRPLRQWEVMREFNRRIKNRFDELGVEIPFPHQTVYFGVDKEGQAPPARVEVRYPETSVGEQPAGPEPAQEPHLARTRGD